MYRPGKFLKHTQVVRKLGDFPAPINGVINLESAVYRLDVAPGGAIVSPYPFVLPDNGVTRIEGDEAAKSVLQYSGEGTMFSSDSLGTLSLKELVVSCPNGKMFDVTGADSLSALYFDAVIAFDVNNFGDVSSVGTMSLVNISFVGIGAGFALEDINVFSSHLLQHSDGKNVSGSLFSFGSGEFGRIGVSQSAFILDSNEYIFNFSQLATFGEVLVSGSTCNDYHKVYEDESLTHKETGFYFSGNEGVPNSQKRASFYMTGNTTYTSLTQGSWAKVSGATTAGDDIEKFSASNNRVTYLNSHFFGDVNIAVSATSNNATDKVCKFAVFKNGALVPGSVSERSINNKTGAIPVQASLSLEKDDYVELWMMNETSDVDILATNINFSIHE